MQLKLSRITSLVLVLIMTALMLASCAGSAPASSQPDAASTPVSSDAASSEEQVPGWKIDTSPITLDWYVNETWFQNPDGNLADQLITEQTGVKVNFIVPVGEAAQMLNTMLASDSLPDMVTLGWYEQQVPELSTETYTYPLEQLAKEHDPYFLEVTDPGILNWYRQDDGNVYAYPCNSVSPDDIAEYNVISNRSFMVRKDIYEAIGSPDMRTPEGFLKALQDAKAKYPTGVNGQPLIPFGSTFFTANGNTGFEDMLLEFLAVPREIDGQYFDVKCGNPAPDYINWLKTFRKAHELGMVPTDVFVDDRTKIEEKIQQGRYFALLYQWKDAMNPLGQLYTSNPDSVYIAVDGPANSKLEPAKLGVPGYSGWELTMITKNCKDPARAIRLMGWGMSPEGQSSLYLGKEGVTYDMKDGKPIIKDEVNSMKNLDMASFKEQYNTYGEIWMFNSSAMNLWEPDPGMPFNQYREWGAGKGAHYGAYDNVRPPADSKEGDILIKAEAKWGEYLPKLLMAESDEKFDALWAEYIAYKDSIQYQSALDYQRQKVAENKAKLGMN